MRMELYGCNYATRPVISGLTNQNLAAAANSYVDLVCIVQEPLIQYIKWYTGNTDITSQSTGLVSGVNGVNSTLRINYTSVDDVLSSYDCFRSTSSIFCFKPYVCRAMYGSDKAEADGIKNAGVKVRYDYPSAMATPTVDNIQSTSVTVRWTQPVLRPFQAAITSYVLHYQDSSSMLQTINVSPPALSKEITGLAIYTSYSVKIRAVSRVGHGQWSQTSNFTTDSALPVVSPASVTANVLTSQSIRVTWQKPSSGVNGPLLGYRLSYSPVSGSATVIGINAVQTSYDITSLNKWTVYRITVKCYNDKGDGPASAEVLVRTLEDALSDAPGQFSVTVLSSTSVQLSWSLPPINSRNGIIRGFEVYYKKTDGSESATTKDLPGNSTLTYTITGLGKYTKYTFKVLAYTKPNMKGPYSNSIDKTTEQDAPSAPTNLQKTEIVPQGSTGPRVKLTWGRPSSPNGIIKYYIVSYSYSQSLSAVYKTNVTGALTVTLPVFGGKTYRFSVKAVTIKEGNQDTKNVVIKVYAPPAPGVERIGNITASTNNVTLWKASSRNGPIWAYQVAVIEVIDASSFDETKLTDYDKAKEGKLHYYIAAEIRTKSGEAFPKIFTIGDEKVYNGYKNMKLEQGKTYNVTQRALTQDEKLENLPGPFALIAKGKVQDTREPCKEQQSQTTETSMNSSYLAVSLAFNAVFVIFIILLVVYYNRKLKNQLEDASISENGKSALTQTVYAENTDAINSEDGLAMSTFPTNSNSTYEQVESVGNTLRHTLDQSNPQPETTGHTTADTGDSGYQAINARTNPKQDTRLRPIYASLHPESKIQNRQESLKGSSSLSPTYQSLQENRFKPVYQSLHTYANTRPKVIGEYNI